MKAIVAGMAYFVPVKWLTAESITYQIIISGKAYIWRKISISRVVPKKKYRSAFSFSFRFLNFRLNIGSSETIRNEQANMAKSSVYLFRITGIMEALVPSSRMSPSEAKKIALAGIGIPRNPSLCRSSVLNLARRNAPETVIIRLEKRSIH